MGNVAAVARGQGDKRLGRGAQKDLEKAYAKAEHPMSLLAGSDIATGTPLTKQQLEGLVRWGTSLGLSPYLGHVCLYYGKPYVTIDGYYYKLNSERPELRVGTCPLTAPQREVYQVEMGDHAWIAQAWENGTLIMTSGLGIVTREEMDETSKKDPSKFRAPIARDKPQRMAEKRAEWQLLRKLIPLEEVAYVGETH